MLADVLQEFDGILEKFRTSGGRLRLADKLESFALSFINSHRRYNIGVNSGPTSDKLSSTDSKMLQLLMLVSESPTGIQNDKTFDRIPEVIPCAYESASSESSSDEDALDEWYRDFTEDPDEEWDSEDFDESVRRGMEDSNFSRDSLQNNREINEEEMHKTDADSADKLDYNDDDDQGTQASSAFSSHLHYGAHISHHAIPPEALQFEHEDFYCTRRPNDPRVYSLGGAVYLQFDVCKMTCEMLLGSPNDLFERRNIHWEPIFSTDSSELRRNNMRFTQPAVGLETAAVTDLKTACRAFALSHYAHHMRVPSMGPQVLKATLIWFAELGSDIYICQKFAKFNEERAASQSRTEELPLRRLMECLRAQVLESLTHITAELVQYQMLLMEECKSLCDDDEAKRDHNGPIPFQALTPEPRRCTLISLYALSQKWRRSLDSLIAFIQTAVNFSQFQLYRLSQQHRGSGGIDGDRDALIHNFYMPFKMIECIQGDIRANSFDLSNAPIVLFRHDKAHGDDVSGSFNLRRYRYDDPRTATISNRTSSSSTGFKMGSFAVFEHFALTHFMHYFVDVCCKSKSFLRDQNYLLKANDAFSFSTPTSIPSRRGGLMKMVLPNLVLLDLHYKLENKSITRFSKTQGASHVNWRDEIKRIKKLGDYEPGKRHAESMSTTTISSRFLTDHEVEQLMRRALEMRDQQHKSALHKYLYSNEYLQSLEESLTRLGGEGANKLIEKQSLDQYASHTTVSEFFHVVPTQNLHEVLLFSPILHGRRAVQTMVAKSVWKSFHLDAHFRFLRSFFLMGSYDLFTAVYDLSKRVKSQRDIADLRLHRSQDTQLLITAMTDQLKSICPSVGVLHIALNCPTPTILPASSARSDYLFQIVDNLSLQVHWAYPLSEIFSGDIMAQYNEMLTFLLRLSIAEWMLKISWSDGAIGRRARAVLTSNIRSSQPRKRIKQRVLIKESNNNITDNVINKASDANQLLSTETNEEEEKEEEEDERSTAAAALDKAVRDTKDWYTFMNRGRLALGLVLRMCTDIRAHYMTLVHSHVWAKFERVVSRSSEAAATSTLGTGSPAATPAPGASRALNLSTMSEITQCHACMLTSLCQSKMQFDDVLSQFLVRAAAFAEVLGNAAADEALLPSRLQALLPIRSSKGPDISAAELSAIPPKLVNMRRDAEDHSAMLETRLTALEAALSLLRASIDLVLKNERVNQSFDGIRELRDLIG